MAHWACHDATESEDDSLLSLAILNPMAQILTENSDCRLPALEYHAKPGGRCNEHWHSHPRCHLCSPVLQKGMRIVSQDGYFLNF
jgi:hypothetical protein